MLINPLTISSTMIAGLHELQLVDVVNQLIWDEAQRLRLAPTQVRTSLRIHDADGGVDAISDTNGKDGDFLSTGLMAWQFKKSWPGSAGLEEEVKKPAVQEVFSQGGGYLLVVGVDSTPRTQREHEKTAQSIAKANGCHGEVRVYHAMQVAHWASRVPSVLLAHRPVLRGYLRADEFRRRAPRHSIPYEPDAERAATIDAVLLAMFSDHPSESHIRIQGSAGVGKTRLALEIVERANVSDLTLYSPNYPSSLDLLNWIAVDGEVEATLIVDECDDTDALHLELLSNQSQGRLRLITVGLGPRNASAVYTLGPLDQSAMENVICAAAPTLPPEQVRWIAEKTQGYVKLGVSVAQAVARNRTQIVELRTDREIRDFIANVIVPDPRARDAITGIALLTRVGWDGDLASEGQAVSDFMGLQWKQVQLAIAPLLREGLVVRKGRYWYVTPELLAIWLAADVWEEQSHRIQELMSSLPNPDSRERLFERLSQLGDVPSVRYVLEEVLGYQGPFRDIASLDNDRSSRLFATLVEGAPETAIITLQRIITRATSEELLAFGTGRRHVVWALEKLLDRREYFFDAAQLLQSLAEHENEHWANNATGTWRSIFLTVLGQTEVPALDRMVLLETALQGNERARELAVTGLDAALDVMETAMVTSRSVTVPRRYWQPSTWGELRDVKRRALELIQDAMRDESPKVRMAAKKVLIDRAYSLVVNGLAPEIVPIIVELEGETPEERHHIWEDIMFLLENGGPHLDPEDRIQLEQAAKRFYGDSLGDRIKRYAGRGSIVNYREERRKKDNEPSTVYKLASEAAGSVDSLVDLLPWLTSNEAENVRPFARAVGELDTKRRWFPHLLDAARQGENPTVLGGYLAGRAASGDTDWREHILDEWMYQQDLAPLVLDAVLAGPHSDDAVLRLIKLIDEGWLSSRVLGWLQYGAWVHDITLPVLVRAVEYLAADSTVPSLSAALALLGDWLEENRDDESNSLLELAWSLVEDPNSWGHEPMLGFYWNRTATSLAPRDPERVTRLVIRAFVEGETSYSDDRLGPLERALAIAPLEAWESLGRSLLEDDRIYRFVWIAEDHDLVSRVPESMIAEWIERHGTAGARAVASIVKPAKVPLPELVRFLLIQYGRDVEHILATNFRTGGWIGSQTSYIDSKLEIVREWEKDSDPTVRQWSYQLASSLVQERKSAQNWDEELF